MFTLSNLWSFIFMYTLLGRVLKADNVMFKSIKDVKLHDLDITLIKEAASISTCANICVAETSFFCETFSWSNSTCLISNEIKINEQTGSLENNGDWITYCRVTYQVFMVQGVNGRYTLTLADGQTECKQRGTTIASREDLLEARGMGYHMCICGWLSDGTGGFVVQYNAPSCTHIYHTGVIDWCEGPMDVYCKV